MVIFLIFVISDTMMRSVTDDAAVSFTASGTLSVSDADSGQALFVDKASTTLPNADRTRMLGTNGVWSYTGLTTHHSGS